MEYTGTATVGKEPSDEIPFSCFSFDADTCFDDDKVVKVDGSLDHRSGGRYGSDVWWLVGALSVLFFLMA